MSLLLLGPPWHHLVTMTKTCDINVFGVEKAEKLAAVQRMIQAVLQSLPQLFFQIYIVSTINTVTPLQVRKWHICRVSKQKKRVFVPFI